MTSCGCSKCSEFDARNSNVHAKQEKKLTPDLPPPPPPPPPVWVLRPDPQGVIFFPKTPHVCAQRDEGIILRYCMLGYPGPPPPPPTPPPPKGSPPPQGPKLVSGLSLNAPHADSIVTGWTVLRPVDYRSLCCGWMAVKRKGY